METEAAYLDVTDLKQWHYCPRIVYYRYCLPQIRPITRQMQAGIRSHEDEAEREDRRSLRSYGLDGGERVFDIRFASAKWGVRGRLDLAIAVPDRAHGREAIVVEYKDSEQAAGSHFKLQLATYALLLEEAWSIPVRRGFFYMIPLRRAEPLAITPRLRQQVEQAIHDIQAAVVGERMPVAPNSRGKCVACEFRRFCNDVV